MSKPADGDGRLPNDGRSAILRTILESSLDVIEALDQAGTILYATPSAMERWGYGPDELAGTDSLDLLHPEDRLAWQEVLAGAKASPGRHMPTVARRIRHKNGGWRQLETRVEALGEPSGPVTILATSHDLTNQKRSEEELLAAKNQFEALADRSLAGLYVIQDGVFKYVNPKFAEMLGYEVNEMIGMNWEKAAHPDDVPMVRENVRKRESGEAEAIQYEFRNISKTGEIIDVEIFGARTVYQGRPAVLGTILNITRRKQLEQALRESEGKFRTLTEKSLVGIYALDGQVITYANPRLAEMYGYDVNEMMGMSFGELVFHEDLPVLRENIRRRESGELDAIRYEFRGIKKNRDLIYVEVYGSSTVNRGRRIAVGTQLDITRRKHLEEALRKSEEQYRLLAENMSDLIWVADPHFSRFTYVSPSVERLLGYTREEFVNLPWETFLTPASLTRGKEHLRRIMESAATGRSVEIPPLELQNIRKDGTIIWTEVVYNLIVDDAGAVVATQGVTRDITKRKEAEEELARKASELARSNAELEQFAYIASHDLQEPLRMVASFTELLARRYKGKLDSDADEFIAFAVDGANRMKQLINDLLAYSRVGTRAKPFARIDCRDVFDRAVSNLTVAIREQGATVKAGPLPTIMGDAVQLTQLFQNLIGNALKFRGPESPLIEVAAASHCDGWLFSVRDNGIGIDSQFFERIFAVFQRLHRKEDYPGTGIGLAICRKIVERHGGRIWVESEWGKGATFYFTMPAKGEGSV